MGPPKITKLVYKWLNSMVYGRYNELDNYGFHGLYKPTTVGRPVNARFIKRFSNRHSVCLCIFYHVYEGFVVLVLGGASTPFFHGSQALSFSI